MNEQIEQWLKADGFREYPVTTGRANRNFFRYVEGATPCHDNKDKPGVQVCIAYYDFREYECPDTYHFEIRGSFDGQTQVQFWESVLEGDFMDKAAATIDRLAAAWERIAAPNPPQETQPSES